MKRPAFREFARNLTKLLAAQPIGAMRKRKLPIRHFVFFAVALGSLAFAVRTSTAASYTFSGGGGATWNQTNTNWSGAPANPWNSTTGPTNIANFNGDTPTIGTGTVYAGGITFASGTTNTINTGIGGVIVLGGSSGNTIINSASNLQTINAALSIAQDITAISGNINFSGSISSATAGTKTLNFNGGANNTLNGDIGDGGGAIAISKTGAGTMVLNGTNTYTGSTTISAGTLQLGAAAALSGTSAIQINAATLDLNGFTTTAPITLNGGGVAPNNLINSNTSTASTYAQTLTLQSDSRIGAAGNLTLSGSIVGAFGFTKSGAGMLILSGASNGATTINVNGTLQIGNGGTSGTLGSGDVTLQQPTAVLIFDRSDDITVTNRIFGNSGANGALIKRGSGTLTLSNGTSSYASTSFAATTTIEEGTIKLGSAGNATQGPLGSNGNGVLVSGTGAALDLNGFTLATGGGGGLALKLNGTGVSNGGALTNTGNTAASWNGLITLQSDSSIVASNGNLNITNSGTITGAGFGLTLGGAANGDIASILGTGAGTLTKNGNGTWTLSAANTYTGATNVTGGTLRLSNAAVPTSSTFSVAANSILEIGANANLGNKTFSGAGTVRLNGGGSTNVNSISVGGMTTSSVFEVNFATRPDFIISGNNPLSNFVGTLNVLGQGIGVGQTTIQANVITGTGPLVTRGADQATINIVGSATDTYFGSFTDNNLSSGWNLNRNGSGTQVLAGSSNFLRQVNVTSGALNLQNNNAVNGPTGTVNISSGAELQLQGGISVTAKPLTLSGSGVANTGALRNISSSNTYLGSITLGGHTRINSDSGTLTLSNATPISNLFNLTFGGAGDISMSTPLQTGASTVTKDGAGLLTLSGVNTYSGGTTISGGTLVMGTASALGTGDLHLNGGKLNANGFALAMGITGNGTLGSTGGPITVSGLVSPGNSPGTITFDANTLFTGDYEWELATYSHTSGGGVYPVGTPGLGGDWDLFQIDGAVFTIDPTAVLSLNNASLAPDSDSFWAESHLWTIIDTINGGSIVNLFDAVNLPSGNGFGTFSTANIGGTQLQLLWTPASVSAVPEPSSILVLFVCLTVGLVCGESIRRARASQTLQVCDVKEAAKANPIFRAHEEATRAAGK